MDIRQFKLATGEEIVCEVVEWHDDDVADIVIRHSYKIVSFVNNATSDRYYTFAPWMVYQEGDDVFQTINSDIIVGSGTPTQEMLKQYFKAKDQGKATQEDLDKKLEDYILNLQKYLLGNGDDSQQSKWEALDSAGKVISFPFDRNKMN